MTNTHHFHHQIVFLTAAMLEGWTPDCPLAASWLSNALGVSHSFGRHLGDDGGDDDGDDGGRDDGNGGGELVMAMHCNEGP